MKLNRFPKLLSEIMLRPTAIRARGIDWLLLVAAAVVLLLIPLEGLARVGGGGSYSGGGGGGSSGGGGDGGAIIGIVRMLVWLTVEYPMVGVPVDVVVVVFVVYRFAKRG